MNCLNRCRIVLTISMAVVPICCKAGEPNAADSGGSSKSLVCCSCSNTNLWQGGVGEGFLGSVKDISVEAGASYGLQSFGSHQSHDLSLLSLTGGRMLTTVMGDDHWYRGNLELRAELFVGSQFSPSPRWLAGLSPHLRYNFATGTRLVPFVDGGVGVTGTGINTPDLSTDFEFNSQGCLGAQWFIRDNVALTLEARYIHISNAGIARPNRGVNTVVGLVGLTVFY